jgi:hypothetical protein
VILLLCMDFLVAAAISYLFCSYSHFIFDAKMHLVVYQI